MTDVLKNTGGKEDSTFQNRRQTQPVKSLNTGRKIEQAENV